MKLLISPETIDSQGQQGWYALVTTESGSPLYDAIGPTVELALAALIEVLGRALENRL